MGYFSHCLAQISSPPNFLRIFNRIHSFLIYGIKVIFFSLSPNPFFYLTSKPFTHFLTTISYFVDILFLLISSEHYYRSFSLLTILLYPVYHSFIPSLLLHTSASRFSTLSHSVYSFSLQSHTTSSLSFSFYSPIRRSYGNEPRLDLPILRDHNFPRRTAWPACNVACCCPSLVQAAVVYWISNDIGTTGTAELQPRGRHKIPLRKESGRSFALL